MNRLLILALALTACATPLRVRIRAAESYWLRSCLDYQFLTQPMRKACLEESHQRCTAQGLERGCAIDGLWDALGRTPTRGEQRWQMDNGGAR